MNQSTALPNSTVSPPAPEATETRLRGRWLLLVRVAWLGLAGSVRDSFRPQSADCLCAI